jgi:hypothetical protein
MWDHIGLKKCIAFIQAGSLPKGKEFSVSTSIRPAITISRMTGAGGHTVASGLAGYLQTRLGHDWTVFDRNLVEQILEDHHLHKGMAEFMQECHKTMFTDVVEEMIGLHPGSWTLLEKTGVTVLRLAQMGNVILVGRGASAITGKLRNAFHVRLVGSLENRLKWVQREHDLDEKSALQFVRKGDEGRKRYLKDHFDKDIDDPLLYHLIVNMDLVRHDEAARLIGSAVIERFRPEVATRAAGSKDQRAYQ